MDRSNSSEGHVSVEVRDGVAAVALCREAKLNALTPAMLAELEGIVERVAERGDVRVLTVTGEGRAFSVGADLTIFGSQTPETARRQWVVAGHRAFARLGAFPHPTLAVVNGPALGGGLELALACDIRIGITTARLGQPEVSLGTLPGWGGTQRLIGAVGAVRARELILTARQLDAATAHAWGLLNAIVEPQQLSDLRDRYLSELLAPAPVAQELAKTVLNALTGAIAPVQALEALAGSLTTGTADLQEGIAAFSSKRVPEFMGR